MTASSSLQLSMDIQLFDRDLYIEFINRTSNFKNNLTDDYMNKYRNLKTVSIHT